MQKKRLERVQDSGPRELENRLKAFEIFLNDSLVKDREDVVKGLSRDFGITKTTVYSWYKGTTPLGRRAGHVARVPELLYVLGALLGDGCPYYWRGNFLVLLVGEEAFARKFAMKLSHCIGKQVRWYKYGSKNAWFVRVGNAELYFLFKRVRVDHDELLQLLNVVGRQEGLKEFIEGFFDAEGCIKVIRGVGRKTPKVCIDLTNTDISLLRLVEEAINESLGIVSKYSTQRPPPPRNQVFHLRIYRKSEIAKFLTVIPTTKLTEEKKAVALDWFGKGVAGKALTFNLPKS